MLVTSVWAERGVPSLASMPLMYLFTTHTIDLSRSWDEQHSHLNRRVIETCNEISLFPIRWLYKGMLHFLKPKWDFFANQYL